MKFTYNFELVDNKGRVWGELSGPNLDETSIDIMNRQLNGEKISTNGIWKLTKINEYPYLQFIEYPSKNKTLNRFTGQQIKILGFNHLVLVDHNPIQRANEIIGYLIRYLLNKLNTNLN